VALIIAWVVPCSLVFRFSFPQGRHFNCLLELIELLLYATWGFACLALRPRGKSYSGKRLSRGCRTMAKRTVFSADLGIDVRSGKQQEIIKWFLA